MIIYSHRLFIIIERTVLVESRIDEAYEKKKKTKKKKKETETEIQK